VVIVKGIVKEKEKNRGHGLKIKRDPQRGHKNSNREGGESVGLNACSESGSRGHFPREAEEGETPTGPRQRWGRG